MNFVKNTATLDEAKEWIRKKLYENTKKLSSYEAIHILLSGGLDSCITLENIRQNWKNVRIVSHTLNYTGTWQGKNIDLEYARKLSEYYKTEHHEHLVTEREMRNDYPMIARMLKWPFAGFVSPFFAAKMLPKGTPVFTGDLSDELFGSYKGPREASLLDKTISPDALADWRYNLNGWCVFKEDDKNGLYGPAFKAKIRKGATRELLKRWIPSTDYDPINAMLGLDWVSAAPDNVFYSPQRLMPDNADVSPFMEREFIDYVSALPGEYKVNKGNVKYILKEAYRGIIPDYVVDRPKEGFVQPSNYWLYHNWKDWVTEVLNDKDMDEHGLFNNEYAHKLVNDYYDGAYSDSGDLQYKVWVLFCFQMWCKQYGVGLCK